MTEEPLEGPVPQKGYPQTAIPLAIFGMIVAVAVCAGISSLWLPVLREGFDTGVPDMWVRVVTMMVSAVMAIILWFAFGLLLASLNRPARSGFPMQGKLLWILVYIGLMLGGTHGDWNRAMNTGAGFIIGIVVATVWMEWQKGRKA